MRTELARLLKTQEHALQLGFLPGIARNPSFSTDRTRLYVIQCARDRAGHRRLFDFRNVLPVGMCHRFDFEGIMVIAERTLTLRVGVRTNPVLVRLHTPQQTMPQRWTTRYEIGWPGENIAADIHGVDAVQALGLALQTIGAEIYASDYHKSGNLFWDTPGNGYGFPVVPTLRDLLEGDDKKYL